MQTRRILLVDDDEVIRELLATTLGPEQFLISMAHDGAEALQIAAQERPDMIFLDVAMPDMDGIEVCRALRRDERTRGTVIIMLTALSSELDQRRAEQAGADAYVMKPFSPLRLRRLVDDLTPRQPATSADAGGSGSPGSTI